MGHFKGFRLTTLTVMAAGLAFVLPALPANAANRADAAAAPAGDFFSGVSPDQYVANHPGAQKTSPSVVSWNNGSVLMVWSDPLPFAVTANTTSMAKPGAGMVSPMAASDCPSGYTCFFQDQNWGGRRVEFRDPGYQSLANYGASNGTSSWVNNRSASVIVYDQPYAAQGTLWTEGINSLSSYVGGTNNDRASSFYSY